MRQQLMNKITKYKIIPMLNLTINKSKLWWIDDIVIFTYTYNRDEIFIEIG